MFKKLFSIISDWINKMIGKQNLKQALNVDIAISSDMATELERWTNIYENKAPWVNYDLARKGPNDIYSMNLGVGIANEIARSVTIEMDATFTGSARAIFLEEQFQRVIDKLRDQVEYGCAKGGLMMKPYVDGDKIAVDFVHADQFYPVAFDTDGDITSAVFVDQRRKGQYWYTRLEYHTMEDAGCRVINQAYKSSNSDTLGSQISLESVQEWAEIEPEALITGVDRPLFAYFRYPLSNNIDPDSPLGVSCYSRATDLIRQADFQWSRFLWEFEAGEMALFIDELALGQDSDGKKTLPNKRLYRSLGSSARIGDLSGEEYFKEWAPTLREESLLNGLEAILRKIEFSCGLAYGTLSDMQHVDKTATEIKISKQRSASTVTDTQKSLEKALIRLLYAMDVWATIGNLAPRGAYDVSFDWDDSIVVDKESQQAHDSRLVGQGIMSKVEFRMRNFGESEDQAKKMLGLVEEERQPMFEIPSEE